MSRFVRSHKARKTYLDNLALGNSESFSAEAAGSTVSCFRRWRNDDENFQADYEEAIDTGTDFIEDVATQRALLKSDPLMMMILKARRPDKYDRGSKLELSGGISVEGAKSKLLNKIARLQASGEISTGGEEAIAEIPGPEDRTPTKLIAAPDPGGAPRVRGGKRQAAAEGSRRTKAA